MTRSVADWPGPRPLVLLALTALVTVVHLELAGRLADEVRLGEGAAERAIRRIEVAFVRELAPADPPPAPPPRARPAQRPRAPAAVAPAASAPAEPSPREPAPVEPEMLPAPVPDPLVPPGPLAAVEPAPVPAEMAPAPVPEPTAAPVAAEPAVAAVPELPASAATAFELPPSTRLSYTLTGYYRGPVEGTAQVEWLRSGSRYQVHLNVRIGPMLSRRMSSEGEIGADGLHPIRYEEETRVLLREPRRNRIDFEPDRTLLPNGREAAAPPGLQDTASQFVQLAWMFNTRPERLRPGEVVTVPLALPRRVENWIYDVVGEERLATPVGEIPAFFLKPRREARRGGDLVVEIWFAPVLQYLPVRIRIRQDEETWADLMLERLPQQGEPGR